jgi:hypothetical protein
MNFEPPINLRDSSFLVSDFLLDNKVNDNGEIVEQNKELDTKSGDDKVRSSSGPQVSMCTSTNKNATLRNIRTRKNSVFK